MVPKPKPYFQKIMKIKNIYQNRFVVESLTCVGDAVSNNEFLGCGNWTRWLHTQMYVLINGYQECSEKQRNST